MNPKVTIDLDDYLELRDKEEKADQKIKRWTKAMQGVHAFLTILSKRNPEIFEKAKEQFNEAYTGATIISEAGGVQIKIDGQAQESQDQDQ